MTQPAPPPPGTHASAPTPGATERALSDYVRRFRRRNGRNPSSGRVHAVIVTQFLGAVPLAVTACGSGVGGASGRVLEPTRHAVTCLLCLHLPGARAAAALVPTGQQLSLV